MNEASSRQFSRCQEDDSEVLVCGRRRQPFGHPDIGLAGAVGIGQDANDSITQPPVEPHRVAAVLKSCQVGQRVRIEIDTAQRRQPGLIIGTEPKRRRPGGASHIFQRQNQTPSPALALTIRSDSQGVQLPGMAIVTALPSHPTDDLAGRIHQHETGPPSSQRVLDFDQRVIQCGIGVRRLLAKRIDKYARYLNDGFLISST